MSAARLIHRWVAGAVVLGTVSACTAEAAPNTPVTTSSIAGSSAVATSSGAPTTDPTPSLPPPTAAIVARKDDDHVPIPLAVGAGLLALAAGAAVLRL